MEHQGISQAANTGVDKQKVDGTIGEYCDLFNQDQGGDVKARKSEYTTMVNHYYDLVTDFYEYGWGDSFHFAPRREHESFHDSILRHEHYLALRLGLKPGQHVIDVGCGVGGPMRNIAQFVDVNITGLNNNAYQISHGEKYNRQKGLSQRCDFSKADFMNMPMDDNQYDAAYAIESTCHAPDRVKVFREIYRILKPGGRFAGYEWCITDRYDAQNTEHQRIKHVIEEGDALPELQPTHAVDAALVKAGFQFEEGKDLVADCDTKTPWYLPLTGRELSIKSLPRTSMGRVMTHNAVRLMELTRIAPKGSTKVSALLNRAADALVKGGELQIFTPLYFFCVQKPLDATPVPQDAALN